MFESLFVFAVEMIEKITRQKPEPPRIKEKKDQPQLFLVCPSCGGYVLMHYEDRAMYWCLKEEKHIENPVGKLVDTRVKIGC